MKILIHKNAQIPVRVISSGHETVMLKSSSCTAAFWELAEEFPGEVIGWCEDELQGEIIIENWNDIFHHDLIMASYAVKTKFLPDSLGYVDQLPFVNVNRKVKFPTWQMSSNVGGIKGEVLLKFKNSCKTINKFDFLLNSVAKIGQQNGLFCYSEPSLTKTTAGKNLNTCASSREVFSFISQHYTKLWPFVLLWCLFKYEKKFALFSFCKTLFGKNKFRVNVDLSQFEPLPTKFDKFSSIDVIIPTLDRKKYLKKVLEDLKEQSLKPKNVIIVEQDPESNSHSQLLDLINQEWPFNIIHHFTHRTGACNARNIALEEIKSEWVFFADDDIRLESGVLQEALKILEKYKISAISLNCKQPGQETVFHKIKQWGSFGAGTSMVRSGYAQKSRFSNVFEFGFGEDADFGMQLRNKGCDIIYHPDLQILHLKASVGGFRKKPALPWEQGIFLPKPSPTLMAYAIKHYTPEQIRGYKVSLFLKFYTQQAEKNPFKYIHKLRKGWKLSEKWAVELLKNEVR